MRTSYSARACSYAIVPISGKEATLIKAKSPIFRRLQKWVKHKGKNITNASSCGRDVAMRQTKDPLLEHFND